MNRSQASGGYVPTKAEVEELLRRASKHPLGVEFLRRGALDAVAATFRVHAFCVDAARDSLRTPALAGRAAALGSVT